MGQQQSTKQSTALSPGQIPEAGYRVIMLSPQYINSYQSSKLSVSDKLNLMTDYVIDKDPRLIDLKELYEKGEKKVQFRVFNVLEYRVRNVKIEIKKVDSLQRQNGNKQNLTNNKAQNSTVSTSQGQNLPLSHSQQQSVDIYRILTKRPYTLGIKFKFYPKINDTILRVSKIFKNSPLQSIGIKKDQYIVGVMEGDFGSIKEFVQLVKVLIQAQLQSITLGVCNEFGETRLQKVNVGELVKWKESYGVGYLGVELAQGWLNKWELKKSIDHNKRRIVSDKGISSEGKGQESNKMKKNVSIQIQKNREQNQQQKQKQQVDFFKHSETITHQEDEHYQQSHNQKNTNKNQLNIDQSQGKALNTILKQEKPSIQTQNIQLFQLDQTSKTSLQDAPIIKVQQKLQQKQQQQQNQKEKTNKNQTHSLPTLTHPIRLSQPLHNISCSLAQQETPSSISSVSSQQIQQKFTQLSQLKQQDPNIIKNTQNILQINFKGILKNQNIDDASTICMCKDYSKHCQKCFKQKNQNYYFFNKKTNKIITIEKAMMFPKNN